MLRTSTRWFLGMAAALLTSIAASGCVATPLPDPPSLDPARMSLTATQPMRVRLEGASGAIGGAVSEIRVTNPSILDERVTGTVTGGAFSIELRGALTDTLFIEAVLMEGDRFLGAVALSGGVVVSAPSGADRDLDGSPDAIDCGPDDRAFAARECPLACVGAGDCATGQTCMGGRCVWSCASDLDCPAGSVCSMGFCTAMTCSEERCGNGIDDDCDGLVDEAGCR